MGGWQIGVIVWLAIGMGVVMVKHGEPKTGNWSFPSHLFWTGFFVFMLYMGGFFS